MTLTEAARFTKRSIYYVGIPAAVIFVGWAIIGMLNPKEDLPEKYITPDYLCGQLPEFELKSLSQATSNTTFSIETTSGAIPDLPKVVNVFKYDHPGQSLLALQEAQIIAEKLGFEPEEYTRKSTVEYEWDDKSSHRSVVIETGNLNITMETDYSNPNVDTFSSRLPSEENAQTIARNYLQGNNLLTTDFDEGTQKTYLIQLTSSGEMREAPSLSEADLIRVDFFREKDLITIDPELVGTAEIGSSLSEQLEEEKTSTITEDDETKEVKKYTTSVVNDSPIFGNISVYLGGTKDENSRDYEVFGLKYRNWPIETLSCGTYLLISPEEAVRQVQEGEATLVYLMEKGGDRIIPYEAKAVNTMTILEVGLSYLDMSEKQDFLQPIFLIRGEAEFESGTFGEFYYYVPAVDYESIPENAGQQQTTDTTDTEE